jgi:hypothetical protein
VTSTTQLTDSYEKAAAHTQQQAEVLLRPFAPPAVSASILSDHFSAKQAAGLLGTLGHASLLKDVLNFAGSQIKAPDTGPAVNKNLGELTDPDHESELRKIRVQSMLQDMMLNDPVISGHDPDDASMAYNEIVEMAPHLADQKLAVQTLMRKRLTQGALDPFEVDQLMGMEGKARSNRQVASAPVPKPAGTASAA